jgi:hypothetical protein
VPKIPKFFYVDPDPIWNLFDPVFGMEKFGSGINIPGIRNTGFESRTRNKFILDPQHRMNRMFCSELWIRILHFK